MIQKSTISLTQADACIAIAHWLNATTFREPVKVTLVSPDTSSHTGISHFEIDIERAPKPETNATQGPQP